VLFIIIFGTLSFPTADGSRRTADAADEQCLRRGWMQQSVMYCGALLCAADIDGPMHTACTAPAEERPASALLSQQLSSFPERLARLSWPDCAESK